MKITEHPKSQPRGYRWRKIGAAQHPDYAVCYWRGSGMAKIAHESSLTAARKTAKALIREGSATVCEVYRYAESAGSIIPVIHCEYGVK